MTISTRILTTTEAMVVSGATRPTIISWIRDYTVDGKPLGYKRGGRWVVRTDQFIEFLRGGGERLRDGTIKEPPGIRTPLVEKRKKKGKKKIPLDPQKGL
jgi:hypothetical protein